MEVDKNKSTHHSTGTGGGFDPSRSLLEILNREIESASDVHKNLSTEYAEPVYEKFERKFIDSRNNFKGMIKDISDEHYPYVNRSEQRKEALGKILRSSTEVAERFQEAREAKRLDRPKCTDSLEDHIYDLKNFKHLIEQSKP
jgi:hypothetical protein